MPDFRKSTVAEYIDPSQEFSLNPVFIMGDHRSGTTLLYKILSSTYKFNYLTSYDVIEYLSIISNYTNGIDEIKREEINQSLIENGIIDRGIDDVLVNSMLPEEYGFILGNYSDSKHITNENLNLFYELCKKKQIIDKNNRVLLLKNPHDFTNIDFISKVIPSAKFIILFRNTKDIAKSNRKAYSQLLRTYNYYTSLLSDEYNEFFNNKFLRFIFRVYFSRYNFIGRSKILKDIKTRKEKFLEVLKDVEQSRYIITTYDSICIKTNTEIKSIFNFLDLDFDDNLQLNKLIRNK